MKKVSKAIWIALGIILAACAAGVLCVNLYIQSAATQARIQQELSRALHMQVKIASASFMPWYGVKVAGITAEPPDLAQSSDSPDSLQVASVGARIRFWKLLRHEVEIKELTIDSANVSWSETPEGRWELPVPASTTVTEASPATAAGPSTPETTAPAQPAQTPAATGPVAAPEAPPTPLPAVVVTHFRLRDSSASFYDKNHKCIASLSGINVQAPNPQKQPVKGTAAIVYVEVQKVFSVENWKANFSYWPGGISLYDTSATVADGTATGSLEVKTGEPDSPFSVDVKFSEVDVNRLLTGAEITQVQASGALSGFLHLQGNLRDSTSATGSGRLELKNGRIAKSDLFSGLGTILQTNRFDHVDLQQAFVDYHISNGEITVDQLTLKSSDMALTSQGVAEVEHGGLSMKARLSLTSALAGQIPDLLVQNFEVDPVSGDRYIDFDITGTISSPRTTLLKVIGKNINYRTIEKSAGSILKSLFGKQRPPPPAATPAPAAASEAPAADAPSGPTPTP